jgi:hypothetical protein
LLGKPNFAHAALTDFLQQVIISDVIGCVGQATSQSRSITKIAGFVMPLQHCCDF